MAPIVTHHFCRTQGVPVQLTWDDVDGQAVNRTCSLQDGCSRYMQPMRIPQNVGELPIVACVLLASDQ